MEITWNVFCLFCLFLIRNVGLFSTFSLNLDLERPDALLSLSLMIVFSQIVASDELHHCNNCEEKPKTGALMLDSA